MPRSPKKPRSRKRRSSRKRSRRRKSSNGKKNPAWWATSRSGLVPAADPHASSSPASPLGPALTPEALAAGAQSLPGCAELTEEMIADDVAAGFVPNPDGTIDLVRYTAWLLRKHGYGRPADA